MAQPSEMSEEEFRAETKALLDKMAREDPEKLKALYEGSKEMEKSMKENPELFQKVMDDFAKTLAVDGGDSAPPACTDKAGCSKPSSPQGKAEAPKAAAKAAAGTSKVEGKPAPKADQDSAPACSKGSAKQCGSLDAGM
eukprot:RCo040696